MSSDSDQYEEMLNDGNDDYLLALTLQTIEEELNSEENKTKNNSIESDYEFALQLSKLNDNENDENIKDNHKIDSNLKNKSIVSPELELLDPSPNIWQLMRQFDDQFFNGILCKHCIELSWSSRMTRTAGLCAWNPNTNFCSIRLSLPLLQLRSRKDLVETLVHEMIHALLFITRKDDNHESHGPLFHEHMFRINRDSGTNITVYHNFHEEVNHYLKHVWRCEGKCRDKSPYFGYVRRAMNRKPGPNDYWFKYHEQTCGGTFVKISEPEKVDMNSKKRKEVSTHEKLNNHDIREYMSPKKQGIETTGSKRVPKIVPFSGFGSKLGSNKSSNNSMNKPNLQLNRNCDNYDSKPNKIENTNKVGSSRSVSNTITNTIKSHSMPKSSANIRTISSINSSEEMVGPKHKQINTYFMPFEGKGNVLGFGKVKFEKDFLKQNNHNSTQNHKLFDSKTSSVIKYAKKPNIDIEVIELD